LAVKGDGRVNRQRAVLTNTHGVHDWGAFQGRPISGFALDGARRTLVSNSQGFLRRSPVGMYPFARNIGDEHIRPIQHTMPGVDAPPGIEPDRDLLSADYFFGHIPETMLTCFAISIL
jgi:hypothetical protein